MGADYTVSEIPAEYQAEANKAFAHYRW